MIKKNSIIYLFFIITTILFLLSCDNNYTPKPRAYFRISLPVKKYVVFDSVCPYIFEYPDYALIIPDIDKRAELYWINIDIPHFKGRIHISYKKVTKKNLYQLFEDARTFVNKHIQKSDNIILEIVNNKANKVYGLIYDIEGIGVASSCQFCLTDSTNHFIRGALYFNVIPNNDSLAPVISFIKKDIRHLINTLKWKK